MDSFNRHLHHGLAHVCPHQRNRPKKPSIPSAVWALRLRKLDEDAQKPYGFAFALFTAAVMDFRLPLNSHLMLRASFIMTLGFYAARFVSFVLFIVVPFVSKDNYNCTRLTVPSTDV